MRRNCLNRTYGSGRKVKGYILLGSKVPFRTISGCSMDCDLSMTHAAATAVEGCGVACRGQRGHLTGVRSRPQQSGVFERYDL